jgi:hypothetical protein
MPCPDRAIGVAEEAQGPHHGLNISRIREMSVENDENKEFTWAKSQCISVRSC